MREMTHLFFIENKKSR